MLRWFCPFILFLGLVACATSAAAQTTDEDQLPVHQLVAQAMIYSFDYAEDVPAPLKSNESGAMVGGRMGYTFAPRNLAVVLGVFGEFTDMETAYDGSLQDGTPIEDDNPQTMVQVEGTIGWDVANGLYDGIRAEFYTGLGYRYWHRELGGPSPFSEDYQWFHIPIGARLRAVAAPGLHAGFDLAALMMLGGSIQFNFSEHEPTWNNPTADLGNKAGFRGRLFLEWYFARFAGLSLVPFYQYTGIGDSNAVLITDEGFPFSAVFEPPSRTHQVGVNLGLTLRF